MDNFATEVRQCFTDSGRCINDFASTPVGGEIVKLAIGEVWKQIAVLEKAIKSKISSKKPSKKSEAVGSVSRKLILPPYMVDKWRY